MLEIVQEFVNDPHMQVPWGHYPVLWGIIVVIVICGYAPELRNAVSHVFTAIADLVCAVQEVMVALLPLP